MRTRSLMSECKSKNKRIKIKDKNLGSPVNVLSAHYQLIIRHIKGVDRNRVLSTPSISPFCLHSASAIFAFIKVRFLTYIIDDVNS